MIIDDYNHYYHYNIKISNKKINSINYKFIIDKLNQIRLNLFIENFVI